MPERPMERQAGEARSGADATRLYRNILLPTDGSEGARRGARHALDLAAKYDATVHVMHVVDARTVGETPALSSDELVLEKFEEDADRVLREVTELATGQGVETLTRNCRGVPAEEITKYATEHDVDLIVMGIHGSERGPRPHVGSTTERVIRTASVPVFPV